MKTLIPILVVISVSFHFESFAMERLTKSFVNKSPHRHMKISRELRAAAREFLVILGCKGATEKFYFAKPNHHSRFHLTFSNPLIEALLHQESEIFQGLVVMIPKAVRIKEVATMVDDEGDGLFSIATKSYSLEDLERVFDLLAIAGADVNFANAKNKRTVLHGLVQRNSNTLPAVKKLIDLDADLFAKDAAGQTPIELALSAREDSIHHGEKWKNNATIALLLSTMDKQLKSYRLRE